ncbi:hypothetical protein M407DRAFT_243208, partial [Tulasnella calospora MUT 4182]
MIRLGCGCRDVGSGILRGWVDNCGCGCSGGRIRKREDRTWSVCLVDSRTSERVKGERYRSRREEWSGIAFRVGNLGLDREDCLAPHTFTPNGLDR